jgi:hypothetical protein
VQSLVIGTVFKLCVDDVVAFRRAGVAFALLGSEAAAAQSDLVSAHNLSAGQKLHHVFFLQDQDGISLFGPLRRRISTVSSKCRHRKGAKNQETAAEIEALQRCSVWAETHADTVNHSSAMENGQMVTWRLLCDSCKTSDGAPEIATRSYPPPHISE